MRTYAVTGSASGIGAATRKLLEARGERVIGVDRNAPAEVIADLCSPDGRAAMIAAVRALCGGKLDGVVACAGGPPVAVNYFGMVATMEGLRPMLASSAAPRAVGVASQAATYPNYDADVFAACLADDEAAAVRAEVLNPIGSYAAAKRAHALWTRRAAVSQGWAGAGIPLNAVGPGIVLTPLFEPYLTNPEAMARVQAETPMPLDNGRMSTPAEMAELLAFLVSPANSRMTGQVIFADGGADAVKRPDSF